MATAWTREDVMRSMRDSRSGADGADSSGLRRGIVSFSSSVQEIDDARAAMFFVDFLIASRTSWLCEA